MGGELDLRLRLGSCCGGGDDERRVVAGQREHQQREHQITIFYNGRICVGNVTEIQARAIIAMAEQEMSNKKKKQQPDGVSSSSPPPPPMEQLLIDQQNSMKRSLRRFLQMRKSRSDAVAPYVAHRPRVLLEIN